MVKDSWFNSTSHIAVGKQAVIAAYVEEKGKLLFMICVELR